MLWRVSGAPGWLADIRSLAHDLRQLADALTAVLPPLATVTQSSVLGRPDTIFELAPAEEA